MYIGYAAFQFHILKAPTHFRLIFVLRSIFLRRFLLRKRERWPWTQERKCETPTQLTIPRRGRGSRFCFLRRGYANWWPNLKLAIFEWWVVTPSLRHHRILSSFKKTIVVRLFLLLCIIKDSVQIETFIEIKAGCVVVWTIPNNFPLKIPLNWRWGYTFCMVPPSFF